MVLNLKNWKQYETLLKLRIKILFVMFIIVKVFLIKFQNGLVDCICKFLTLLNIMLQTPWCWTSISTHPVRGGDTRRSIGKTTGRRETRRTGFMAESGS